MLDTQECRSERGAELELSRRPSLLPPSFFIQCRSQPTVWVGRGQLSAVTEVALVGHWLHTGGRGLPSQ